MSTKQGDRLEELSDLCTPWCIHVVSTLRIAEHIFAGIDQIEDLAEAAGCDSYALHHVLGHLVSKGLFEEVLPGQYRLNELSRELLNPSNRLDLDGIWGRFALAWGTLLTYVRTGRSGYHEQFGRSFWDDLAAHPAIGKDFDDLMGPAGHGVPDPNFPITGGWESIQSVVDVGGGTGAMLAEILRRYPQIQGTLVDLPGTVARSAELFQTAGVAQRVKGVGQSFFDPLPAGSDLYLLRKVLNNWPDQETIAILRRCAEAAGTRGRVIILDGVSSDDAPRRLTIETVLLGGTANTLSQFRKLAHEAGLEITLVQQQPSGSLVVECCPI